MRKRALSVLSSAGYDPANVPALAALVDYAAQSPGIDPRNYYSPHDSRPQWWQGRRAYESECRSVSRAWGQLSKAVHEAALVGVEDRHIIDASKSAFSGRFTWLPKQHHDAKTGAYTGAWEYTTGQYWCTEYRAAALAVVEYATRLRRLELPPTRANVTTIEELKALNAKNGGCWFDRASTRFFGTVIHTGILPGSMFITSEQPPHGPRKFSVRTFSETGHIGTLGEFCGYESLASAREAARAAAAAEVVQS